MTTPERSTRPPAGDGVPTTHIYVLLDRSGSMESIRPDVIGGFNSFVRAQNADGAPTVLTLAQFDTVQADDVLYEAAPIGEVPELTDATFVPRGGTPLLDATGLLVARAQERAARRVRAGLPAESLLFVSITDGHENSSREFTRRRIVDLIKAREADGWTFVFLSASLDVYAEAGGLGYDTRAVQAFAPAPAGVAMAFASLSDSATAYKEKVASRAVVDASDFFVDKRAEADRRRRERR